MSDNKEKWFTGQREHEGTPLHLRFPEKRDYKTAQPKFPLLIWATHRFSFVMENGLPTSEYNSDLADLDERIVESIPCPVLVETFGGNRTYYGYAPSDFDVKSAQASIKDAFPSENVTWESKPDPHWKLIKSYSQEFGFYSE